MSRFCICISSSSCSLRVILSNVLIINPMEFPSFSHSVSLSYLIQQIGYFLKFLLLLVISSQHLLCLSWLSPIPSWKPSSEAIYWEPFPHLQLFAATDLWDAAIPWACLSIRTSKTLYYNYLLVCPPTRCELFEVWGSVFYLYVAHRSTRNTEDVLWVDKWILQR